MNRRVSMLVVALLVVGASSVMVAAGKPAAQGYPMLDIPFERFVLSNGLTLIVHEDHKAPIVAVNIWYHVGSKNEKPGKTGFAHLFEHLMFNGSENFNDDYFQALEKYGATDLNGTTNNDRTNYFQNVPVSALDLVLWLESDRMGHLLGSVDQAKLDEQRGVVQNEKRQYDNTPYSIAEELTTRAIFPEEHPYGHTVIGSLEDLGAASLDDVKEFFQRYYGAANAVVAIAGDIDAKTAKAKVEKYFGDIPSGPPIARSKSWIPKRTGTQEEVAQDRVPQARLTKVWAVPGIGTADQLTLELLADVLVTRDKTSRLYKRLVYDDQIATEVNAYLDDREVCSLFTIDATARPGDDLSKVEAAIDEELSRLLATGPTVEELERVKTQYISNFIRGAEGIGGFGGKTDILLAGEVYEGRADAYRRRLDRVAAAKPEDVVKVGRKWLSDGVYNLQILPFPEYAAAESGADRSKSPAVGAAPEAQFPKIERATLSNGLKIVVAERHAVPLVNLDLLVDSGWASDSPDAAGTASLAMGMLDEGTKTRTALDLSRELASLGARLNTGSNLDLATVTLSTLTRTLDPALKLFADIVSSPSFPEADFERLKRLQVSEIQNEKSDPFEAGLRVLPRLLYGSGHSYGSSYRGRGNEESVSKLTRADLSKFHERWFRPNNATLVITGDTTLARIQPKLEALFAGWKAGEVPTKNIGKVERATKRTIYLIDKPDAVQSVILAGIIGPPRSNPQEDAIEAMNTVLGGMFVSRLNMNLREDKHWSYGAGSFLRNAKAQRPFIAYTQVQTDKTKESIVEVDRELREIVGKRPLSAEELSLAKSNLTLALPGLWETSEAVSNTIADIVRFDLPDDDPATYARRIKAVTLPEVAAAATAVVSPDQMTWVIVGDRAKVENGIRELGFGELTVIDADGKPVK